MEEIYYFCTTQLNKVPTETVDKLLSLIREEYNKNYRVGFIAGVDATGNDIEDYKYWED